MALKIAARYSWTSSTLLQLGRQKLKFCDFPSNTLEIKALITKNTEITRNHLTPEIALHLITPACPLWKAQLEDCPFNDPFWGFYWPGGQAVTRFILDNPAVVRGLSVIDIGSGCAASAIASSKCGAKLAIANDIDLVAGTAARMNAALNDTVIEISSEDHFERNEMENFAKHQYPWDVVIIGDLFYDPDMSKRVMAAVKKWSSMGALVLIGDPGRYAFIELTKTGSQGSHDVPCLSLVKQYPLPEHSCLENNGFSHASVWRLS
ncbi:electron transfer flavoprotein beta subunit lysine methyltransferase-like [Ischnura elegans]|uniref:electron transfer flavoprotein beta subunit lysine methyltransferase-like n=1 Tax=Ischnura elegans TaxID=197161 RepID=UPI001ED867FE|nr:electron transfer flavoprotein beta subunit lysine methyltransferase-like [Ischnura elegans]